MTHEWPIVPLAKVIRHRKEFIKINDLEKYKRPRVQSHARRIVLRDEVPGAEIKTKQQQVCRAGEFLVAEIDAKVGGYGIVPVDLDGSLVSSHYFLFEIDSAQLDQGFLDYFIRTPTFHDQVAAQGSTNYAAIRAYDVLEYEIPLPPLDEQRRLVARIEALAAKIEEARGLRRPAVEEAEALFESAKRGCIGAPRTNPFGWPTKPLGEVAETKYGISAPISDSTDAAIGTPIVRMANIALDGTLSLNDLRYYLLSEKERNGFFLKPGDLLLNWRSGSAQHVGKTALFSEQGEYTFASFLLRVRANEEIVTPEYLKATLNFMRYEGVFLDAQRFQVNTKLNAAEFSNFHIMLPPLEEQRRIVAYLDGLQGKVDALKSLQAQTQVELDALLPSVLDKAFKGEL